VKTIFTPRKTGELEAAAAMPVDAPPGLTYEQTVPRGLVHRWSLSEVFLTGYQPADGRSFICAAQLPLSHAYFGDHPDLPHFHDPLNVLEACRQAVTYAAHIHQGVPRATTFMVNSWSLEIKDPEALICGERPGELRINGTITDRRERGGHVRRLGFAMDMAFQDRALGQLSMGVSCTPTDQYHTLRRLQRGTDVPTALALPADPVGEPVAPADAGRLDPRNVVLDDAHSLPGALSAVLSPRTFRNRSMYDHPYDHVPAMVLSEAARQCALLLSDKLSDNRTVGGDGARRVLRLAGRFLKFAELDNTVGLTVYPTQDPASYRMTAVQGEATVAEVDVLLG
jgi:hypothetical protein